MKVIKTPLLKNIYLIMETLNPITELENMYQVIEKCPAFHAVVKKARMEEFFKEPMTRATLFIPLDDNLPVVGEIDFHVARHIVNSVVIPWVATTTTIKQAAFSVFQTRHRVNSLQVALSHRRHPEPRLRALGRCQEKIVLNQEATVIKPNIVTRNGVVHIVDVYPYIREAPQSPI